MLFIRDSMTPPGSLDAILMDWYLAVLCEWLPLLPNSHNTLFIDLYGRVQGTFNS